MWDLSGEVQLAWDALNLYLGAPPDGRPVDGDGRPEGLSDWWEHDSVAVLITPPVWLTYGSAGLGPGGRTLDLRAELLSAGTIVATPSPPACITRSKSRPRATTWKQPFRSPHWACGPRPAIGSPCSVHSRRSGTRTSRSGIRFHQYLSPFAARETGIRPRTPALERRRLGRRPEPGHDQRRPWQVDTQFSGNHRRGVQAGDDGRPGGRVGRRGTRRSSASRVPRPWHRQA